MLAGSLSVLCVGAFAQTQAPAKPPATGTSPTTTKPAGAQKTTVASKTPNATKRVASNTSHTSATGSTTLHKTSTGAKKKTTASKSARVKMQTAPTSDRIKEIQSALTKAGAYDGEPTGNWDAHTAAAMTKFQQSNGLTPTGKLDALSLQKLGLGSDTAGKGSPRPATAPTTSASSTTGNHR
jgi:peptidoglycan hydrolase-like protein with peptidoglycan-binding domain